MPAFGKHALGLDPRDHAPTIKARWRFEEKPSRSRLSSRHLGMLASAPLSKLVIHCSTARHELRKQRGTSKFMMLVPLFDLKFLDEFAAGGAGTSDRRH